MLLRGISKPKPARPDLTPQHQFNGIGAHEPQRRGVRIAAACVPCLLHAGAIQNSRRHRRRTSKDLRVMIITTARHAGHLSITRGDATRAWKIAWRC